MSELVGRVTALYPVLTESGFFGPAKDEEIEEDLARLRRDPGPKKAKSWAERIMELVAPLEEAQQQERHAYARYCETWEQHDAKRDLARQRHEEALQQFREIVATTTWSLKGGRRYTKGSYTEADYEASHRELLGRERAVARLQNGGDGVKWVKARNRKFRILSRTERGLGTPAQDAPLVLSLLWLAHFGDEAPAKAKKVA